MTINLSMMTLLFKRVLLVMAVAMLSVTATPREQSIDSRSGQASTLLADGSWLLTGGTSSHATAKRYDAVTRQSQRLPDLNQPRAWHTSTVMPSGEILVLGGLDAQHNLASKAEFFDITSLTFTTLPALPLMPRAAHTATVLTDGRLLIVGGVSQRGEALSDVELWDPATNTTEHLARGLNAGRYQHSATLLPDGSVAIWGGKGRDSKAIPAGERFYPNTNRFVVIESTPDATPAALAIARPEVAGSLPTQGATQVAVDAQPALRLNHGLDVKTVNPSTLTLVGPLGVVAAKVVAAEAGALVFITPAEALKPNTQYRVLLNAPMDVKGYPLTGNPIAFTTAKAGTASATGNKRIGANRGLASLLLTAQDTAQTGTLGSVAANFPGTTPVAEIREFHEPLHLLPSLKARKGVTAVSGVVMTQLGQPLANVLIEMVGTRHATRTDTTGRFLLQGVPAGKHELWIDARPASRQQKTYGTFVVAADVKQGKTYVLPYIAWMPEIDTTTEVEIASPTQREVVLTTPKIPGLEVHIPAGAIVRDHAGKRVTKLSVTPIPVDRPPFPLPTTFAVPVFFTVQPGGAALYNADGSPALARVIYPNYTHRAAGARVEFWHYEPDESGWAVYGKGAVTANGKQVVPDPGVGIYEFMGAMINTGNGPPPAGPPPGGGPGSSGPGGCSGGGPGGGGPGPAPGPAPGSSGSSDPVDTATGLFIYDNCDLIVGGTWPLKLTRTYRQSDVRSRPFGIGMTHDYEMFLWSAFQYAEADLILPTGGRVHFARISPGSGFEDAEYESTDTPTRFYKARLKWNGDGWNLTLTDGTVYVFGNVAPMQSMHDRYGNTVTLTRTPAGSGNVTHIEISNARYIDLQYDAANHVTQATDNLGRVVTYQYDLLGRMIKATYPNNSFNEYTWDTCPAGPITDVCTRMLSVKDRRGNTMVTNQFDATTGRVTQQTYADATTNLFAYTVDGSNKITQTDVTDQRGFVTRLAFNAAGYVTSDTYASGQPEQQIITFARSATGNQMTDVTDPLGRVKHTTYDTFGNVASVTELFGTANAVTTSYTYEPLFQQLQTVTDPLSHVTTFIYDVAGNRVGIKDANNNQTNFTNNAAGQPLTVTDPLGHITTFEYSGADLVRITDPLNRVTTRFVDAIGRLAATTDPLGNVTQYVRDPVDRLLKTIDAQGNTTEFSYDPNGNMLTHKDQRGNVTQYAYNSMNLLITRTDPLLKTESFVYDPAGNLIRSTDRKGQVSGSTYDALSRRSQAGYGATVATPTAYLNTIGYTYDAGNRVTTLTDSANGTITRGYDNLDRITSETSTEGTLNYTYDNANRRASMTVAGQSQVTYGFDNANRLTSITQGAQSVGIGYDSANRRTTLTLPNGINLSYGFDNANQLTAITYSKGAATLGDLSYSYDVAGRRISQGGTFARLNLPAAQSGNVHNANNRLTQLGATPLSYDDNGNLLSDGANTYTWNSRDQLDSIAGPVAASFQYDASGRRKLKTVSGITSKYLYDGANAVQELNGSNSIVANHLTGLGIDEIFTRTEGATTKTLISDALGSTIAMADSTGIVTSWTYDAYGKATYTGQNQSNSYLYTGRELDGTGLYYYRARYYHPTLSRFISEDPIGIAAGPNSYAYVGGNPVSFVDPQGEFFVPIVVGIASFAAGYYAGGKIGDKVVSAADFFGNKNSAEKLAEYSKSVIGACMSGNSQACGAMESFEQQRMQCIGETVANGAKLSNVPSGGPLQSQLRNAGSGVGKGR